MATVCDKQQQIEPQLFLCLHCGAGEFSKEMYGKYKAIMAEACKQAKIEFEKTSCVRTAVITATEYLENSELINAGINGSSVTLNGTIECEAALLNVNTQKWAALTSISNINNPIRAVETLYLKSKQSLSHGRIPPIFLCGNSAQNWCKENGIPINNKYKLSSHQQSLYNQYSNTIQSSNNNNNTSDKSKKRKLCETDDNFNINNNSNNNSNNSGYTTPPAKRRKLNENEIETSNNNATDLSSNNHGTCGVIGFDISSKIMYVTTSSGGIWMKNPGRIGPSAVIGSGFDGKEMKLNENENIVIGCCASGSGEYLMEYRLSKECCDELIQYEKDKNNNIMDENILNNVFDKFRQYVNYNNKRTAGCLVMKIIENINNNNNNDIDININFVHNSTTMGIGVLCNNNIKTYMSTNDDNKIVISGCHFNINEQNTTNTVKKPIEEKSNKKINTPMEILNNNENKKENTEQKTTENRNSNDETTENKEEKTKEKTFMNGMEILSRDWKEKFKGEEIEYDSDPNGTNNTTKSHIHKAKVINIKATEAIGDEDMYKMVVKFEDGGYQNYTLSEINIKLEGEPTMKGILYGKKRDCDYNNGMHNHNHNMKEENDKEDVVMIDNETYLKKYEIDKNVIDKYPSDLPSFMIESPINEID